MECVSRAGKRAGRFGDVERVENGMIRVVELWQSGGGCLLTKSGRGGRQIGLKAGGGGRHVIYHFSLGRNEDMTRIHTKK